GWVLPSNQEIFKSLRQYFCKRLDVDADADVDKPVVLKLYSSASYFHDQRTCYKTCSQIDPSTPKPLCLRTWVYKQIHKTDGKMNKNVVDQPWFKIPSNNGDLTNVCGRITAVYIPKDSSKVKLWCSVEYGEVEALQKAHFDDDEFAKLLNE